MVATLGSIWKRKPGTLGSGEHSPHAFWERVRTREEPRVVGALGRHDLQARGRGCTVLGGPARGDEAHRGPGRCAAAILAGRPSGRLSPHSAHLQWTGLSPCCCCISKSPLCPLLCPTGLENNACWWAPWPSVKACWPLGTVGNPHGVNKSRRALLEAAAGLTHMWTISGDRVGVAQKMPTCTRLLVPNAVLPSEDPELLRDMLLLGL